MQKKVYYLSTCNTCQRILKELALNTDPNVVLQNIKESPITEKELESLLPQAGSYENLFNRRSRQYQAQTLQEQTLTEADYKRLILEEYTFLKRPIIVLDEKAFIGNSKKVVAAALSALQDGL